MFGDPLPVSWGLVRQVVEDFADLVHRCGERGELGGGESGVVKRELGVHAFA
jgi:hypothetical protein